MSEPKELSAEQYDRVIEAMKNIIDPEIGVNIVDLGLVYGLQESDDGALLINMTLTSAGCPLTDVIEEQTGDALDGVVEAFRINWVWMPPWGPEKISEDGREMMRAIGFSI
jgi:metal-sulfur cluster biosynthetic enzyme